MTSMLPTAADNTYNNNSSKYLYGRALVHLSSYNNLGYSCYTKCPINSILNLAANIFTIDN